MRADRSDPPTRSPTRADGIPETRREVVEALRSLGVVPSRRWGQSFLVDPFVADAEAALVAGGPAAEVIEIGGGLGILSRALLRRGFSPLTIVEKDRRLAAYLRRALGDQVVVVAQDALTFPLALADCYVGNLPYSVATPILLRLMSARVPRIVFLVQREVAERLAAGPGSRAYGRLSILAQLYGSVELYRTVSAGSFEPAPRVESRLATFAARSEDLPVPSVPEFERIVRTLFASRRKQLGNLLPRVTPPTTRPEDLARESGWPSDWARKRPEDLPPSAYFALARASHAGAGSSHPRPRDGTPEILHRR